MKENFQIHIWLGLLLCLLGMSCSDDTPAKGNEPGNGNTELKVNEWIESVMRSDYLWNNDIPAQNKLDFSADPQTFFSSMLSLKDGKTRNGKHLYYYSYMEKNKDYKARTSIDADDTYGMEFTLFNVVNDSNQPLGYYYARILYVLPNSPASSAGLERGDWIVGIKGKNNINSDNYGILLNGDRTQWLVKRGDTEVRTIDIEASRAVEAVFDLDFRFHVSGFVRVVIVAAHLFVGAAEFVGRDVHGLAAPDQCIYIFFCAKRRVHFVIWIITFDII